jgi:hypothetical protein
VAWSFPKGDEYTMSNKKGDIVMVYEDPITEQKPEGKAKLLAFVNNFGELENWEVKFLDDGTVTTRAIKVTH